MRVHTGEARVVIQPETGRETDHLTALDLAITAGADDDTDIMAWWTLDTGDYPGLLPMTDSAGLQALVIDL